MSNGAAAQTDERDEHLVRLAHEDSTPDDERPSARARPLSPAPTRRQGSVTARTFGVIGMSLGAHMTLLAVLGFMPRPVLDERKLVEMEIAEPEPPPPPPPPAAEEPPKPEEPAPKPKLAPKIVSAPKLAAPEAHEDPKPAAEAPVDLTGVTLTGEDGASWSSVVGNGEALHGPAARIGRVTGNDRSGGVVGKAAEPVLVAEASLSRKPVAPDGMDALLEQFFPPRARAQGVSGTAQLRVRILSDGRVGDMLLVRETGEYGFGNACMKALRQRRWQAPLDRHGQPVSTEIRYSCEFEVSY